MAENHFDQFKTLDEKIYEYYNILYNEAHNHIDCGWDESDQSSFLKFGTSLVIALFNSFTEEEANEFNDKDYHDIFDDYAFVNDYSETVFRYGENEKGEFDILNRNIKFLPPNLWLPNYE